MKLNKMHDQELLYRTLLQADLKIVENLMLGSQLAIPQEAYSAIKMMVRSGGKRLRPALVLLSSHICGADLQRARPVAAAIELLHTATLIHDDLIDEAPTRRGIETLNSHWSAPATVLAGDTAFARAATLATQGQSLPLMKRFSETLETICSGELEQLFLGRGHIPDRTEYQLRIYAKTASLFAVAAEAGPHIAGADSTQIESWQAYGSKLGMAFQIADDVLDLMGDPRTLGKPQGSDLLHGLVTLPVLIYLETHPNDQRVVHAATGMLEQPALAELLRDLRSSGIADLAMEEADRYIHEALTFLSSLPASLHRDALEEITRFAVRRHF